MDNESDGLRRRGFAAAETVRYEEALAGIDDHFVLMDEELRYVFVNARAAEILGKPAEELIGHRIWDLYPSAVGNQFYQELHRAVSERVSIHSEHYYAPFDRWYENHIYPFPGGVCVFSTDITELKLAQLERERLHDVLREADRRKDEFLAMLAHELRNPLAPILQAVQILRRHKPTTPEEAWCEEVIERQTAHLTRLVDDLLDISRITQGKVTLRREPVELQAAVTRAVETVRPFLEGRRHELVLALPDEPLVLEGDLIRLAQILANLLHNAAKYTPDGGRIELSAEHLDGVALLRLRDNGIGIPPEMLSRVFDLFTQADRSLSRSEGGIGVGLTLVRTLVELHGGSVEALSPGPGHGTEILVRLPARLDLSQREQREEAAPVEPASPKAAAGRRILVVDDNQDSAESLALLLEIHGHEVRTAFAGLDALETASTFRPDVVLLDIGLPGMDGYEVARRLRADDHRGLLVALTGYGRDDDRQRSLEAGFDHHLVKPVDLDELARVLS
jgi:PAS domain S-box-containing protein